MRDGTEYLNGTFFYIVGICNMLICVGMVNHLVIKVEALIDRYPRRFPSMEEAKAFIKRYCDSKGFDYGFRVGTSVHMKLHVTDRVHFLVALHAFHNGEFHLNIPPAGPGELRRTYAPAVSCPHDA